VTLINGAHNESAHVLNLLLTNPIRSGLLIGILLGMPHLVISDTASVELASMSLVFIAGIYVGFAITHGDDKPFLVETISALGYVLLAILGILFSRWILVLGLVAHGLWDSAHHRKHSLLTDVPTGYAPFCAVTDITFAMFLLGVWFI